MLMYSFHHSPFLGDSFSQYRDALSNISCDLYLKCSCNWNYPFQICANLDTEKIMSSDKYKFYLNTHVPQPKKQYDVAEERPRVSVS